MSRNVKNASLSQGALQHSLGKSRRRRAELAALATASPAPHLIRNDLVPKLALVECAPADLIVPARNVRTTHLREVANAISSVGFCEAFGPARTSGLDRP